MSAIAKDKIESQALDVMGLNPGDLPAFSLTLKIDASVDGILLDWPVIDDGTGEGITLTNAREIRAFERAAGAEAAAKYLETPAGADLWRKVKRLKLGDIEKEWANAPIPEPGEAAKAARAEKTNCLRRIGVIGGASGSASMFARSGATVAHPEPPNTLIEQAFGPDDWSHDSED